MTTYQLVALAVLWGRSTRTSLREDERGAVTETVILVAVFAALALAVGAIIVVKVTDKANSIPTQ
jgi:hypothetical protein